MQNNILRLADLLRKDTLTSQEKREAINLAQAMFGTTARGHGDAVLVALKRKKTVGGDAYSIQATQPGAHVVHGGGHGQVLDENDQPVGGKIVDDPEAKEFSFEFAGDTYKRATTKAGQQQYRRNGKVVAAAVFTTALAAANGAGDVEES